MGRQEDNGRYASRVSILGRKRRIYADALDVNGQHKSYLSRCLLLRMLSKSKYEDALFGYSRGDLMGNFWPNKKKERQSLVYFTPRCIR